eukprot:2787806-Pyramimonas_sp.AAC.1
MWKILRSHNTQGDGGCLAAWRCPPSERAMWRAEEVPEESKQSSKCSRSVPTPVRMRSHQLRAPGYQKRG